MSLESHKYLLVRSSVVYKCIREGYLDSEFDPPLVDFHEQIVDNDQGVRLNVVYNVLRHRKVALRRFPP